MAPIPILEMHDYSPTTIHISDNLTKRHLDPVISTPTLVVLSLVCLILLASAIYILYRIRNTTFFSKIRSIHVKIFSKSSTCTKNIKSDSSKRTSEAPITGEKLDQWARKGSNVLWSMYIDEDDLKSQFTFDQPRVSRLFSIGSISDQCPLETHTRRGSIEVGPKNEKSDATTTTISSESVLRNRPVFEHETTPTKSIASPRLRRHSARPAGITETLAKHRYSRSFDTVTMTTITPPTMLEWRKPGPITFNVGDFGVEFDEVKDMKAIPFSIKLNIK